MGMIKTEEEIQIMREVCKQTSVILNHLIIETKIGDTGIDVNNRAKKYIELFNMESAFFGLYGFPAQLCISKNNYIIHCIPDNVPFKNGDIITYDFGCKYKGFCSDMARSFIVGHAVKESHVKLLKDTKKALELAIATVKDGSTTDDISRAIENFAKENGYGNVEDFGGHGIGEELHQPPHIYNSVRKGQTNVVLRAGMTIAIEPMLILGNGKLIFEDGNKWAIKTEDGSVGTHEENTVLVTRDGSEVLTR